MWPPTSRQSRGYGRAWELLREQALKRDSYLCVDCAAMNPPRITLASEVHHIKQKADGGTETLENLVSICHACHQREHIEARGGKAKVAFDRHGRPTDPAHPWNKR